MNGGSPLDFVIAGLVGLFFGSLVSLVAYRIARDQPIIGVGCAGCRARLGIRDLFPLLYWIESGGRCGQCGEAAGNRYPLVEGIVSMLFIAVFTVQGAALPGLLLGALVVGLVMLAAVDMEIGIIPDVILVPLAPLGLVYGYFGGGQGVDDVVISLIGGAFAGGVAFAVHYGFKRLRGRDGLGLGDVKFFAVAGLWLGPFGLPGFMIISGVMGIVFALLWRRLGGGKEFPFGPALASGLMLCLLFPAIPEIFGLHTNLQ